MNILHLPSWFPTPDDPTLGNFCIRMIDALPQECNSVILSVCNGRELTEPFEVHEIHGTNFATDFTIMHPKTGAIILWEHFGLADNPDYQRKIEFKLIKYLKAGYLPGHNMIITFEDSAHPLSFIEIEEIVKKYFS